MRGWQSSDSLRANRHWQSGTGSRLKEFDILKDEWHGASNLTGANAWGNTQSAFVSTYYLGKPYGGGVASSHTNNIAAVKSASDIVFRDTALDSDDNYYSKAFLYNKVNPALTAATQINVTFSMTSVPPEISGSTIRFALAQGGVSLSEREAGSYSGTTITLGDLSNTEVAESTRGRFYPNASLPTTLYNTCYYVEMTAEPTSSVTWYLSPASTGGTLFRLQNILFWVGLDVPVSTLTGTWKWSAGVDLI